MVKNKKIILDPVQKKLAVAGTAIVVFGSLSSVYYLYVNLRFIHELSFTLYYLSYLVVLSGGFAAGYLLTRKGSRMNRACVGASFALLALLFYTLTFAVNFIAEKLFGALPFPWGRILFDYAPLIALVITSVIAYMLQFRRKQTELTRSSMKTFVCVFLAAQLYDIGNTIYWTVTTPGTDSSPASPLWLLVGGYLLNPLLVSIIAFLSFKRIKSLTQRLFSAAFVGTFSYVLLYGLWNFNTSATVEGVYAFQSVVYPVVVLLTGGLIWRLSRQR